LIIAGKNKGLADPFLPENPEQTAHLQKMLDEVHQHFIEAVKQGRGERLSSREDLFSGLIWTGEKAIELGLVDDYGTTQSVARDVIKASTIIDYTPKGALIDQLIEGFGVTLSKQIQSQLGSNISLH
jgi:protease-4